jgi:hypothetical protein
MNNRVQGASATGAGFAYSVGANAAGGAITSIGGVSTFELCSFRSNSAAGGDTYRYGGYGEALAGAIYNRGTLTLLTSELIGNVARAGAGAQFSSTAPGAWGGAVCNDGMLAVSRCVLADNLSVGSKGGCFGTTDGWPGGPAFGGGICNLSPGSLFVTNSTVAANTATGGPPCDARFLKAGPAYGSGIYTSNGTLSFVNVTVAGNVVAGVPSDTLAGANIGVTNGTLTFYNTVIAYPGTNANVWGTIIDGGYNMCSDGSANFSGGTSFNFSDPKLLPLADNGGPILTMALAADSPAIDWAPSVGAPSTDQRGVLRPYGAGVDIGAFEWTPPGSMLTLTRVGNAITLSFAVTAGVPYRIEFSAALPTWQLYENLGTVPTNGVVTRSIAPSNAWRFFRVSAY